MSTVLSGNTFTSFVSESSFFKLNRYTDSAWIQHVPFAFWLAEQLQPRLFVELGVHTGMSYFAFCQSIKANNSPTQCYAVDTWTGDEHSGLYDETIWQDVNEHNTAFYSSFSTLLRTSFSEALPYFEDGSIDLLHIDGYHTYEAVKKDVEDWLPKMSDNGIILFHDIAVRERSFGVYKLWSEFKQQYKFFEFFHGHGLGVIALGSLPSNALSLLFQLKDESEINKIRTVYANLGNRLSDDVKVKGLQNQLSTLAMQNHELGAAYENLRIQNESARQEYEELKKIQEQLTEQQETLKNEKAYAEKELEKAKQHNILLQADVVRLTEASVEMEAAHNSLEQKHEYLKNQHEEVKSEIEHIKTELKNETQETALLKTEILRMEAALSEAETLCHTLKQKDELLKKDVEQLLKERKLFHALQEQSGLQKAELRKSNLTIALRDQQLKGVRSELEVTRKEIETLLIRGKSGEEALQNKNAMVAALSEQLTALSTEYQNFKMVQEGNNEELIALLERKAEGYKNDIRWYQATYENRKLLGIVKDKFLKSLKK